MHVPTRREFVSVLWLILGTCLHNACNPLYHMYLIHLSTAPLRGSRLAHSCEKRRLAVRSFSGFSSVRSRSPLKRELRGNSYLTPPSPPRGPSTESLHSLPCWATMLRYHAPLPCSATMLRSQGPPPRSVTTLDEHHCGSCSAPTHDS